MDLFADHLGLSTIKINIAKFLAYNIEASINELHCSIGDSKSYIAKARSLSYNLKRNEVREMTEYGATQCAHVYLPVDNSNNIIM